MSSNEAKPLSPKAARLVGLATIPVGVFTIWWEARDFARIDAGETVMLPAPIHLMYRLFGGTGALVTLGIIFVLFALLMLAGSFASSPVR